MLWTSRISAVRPGPWQSEQVSAWFATCPFAVFVPLMTPPFCVMCEVAVLVVWQVRQAETVGESAMSSVMAVRSAPACFVTANRFAGSRP